MKTNNLNKLIIKQQMEFIWKKQRFQKLLQDKILYVLEHGDVMIDMMELKKYLKNRSVRKK